jgi:hypothetical protein
MMSEHSMLTKEDILKKSKGYAPKAGKYGYVYFLLNKNEIVYVGQTLNIEQRLRAHCRDKKFERVSYIKVLKRDLNYTEAYYIVKFRPPYNQIVPPYYFEPNCIEIPDENVARQAYDKGKADYERIAGVA